MMANRDIELLGLNVIKQAIKDAVRNPNLLKRQRIREEVQINKDAALSFLTEYNEDFEFWCLAANLQPETVQKEVSKILTQPDYCKVVLNKINQLEKDMETLQTRIKTIKKRIYLIKNSKFKSAEHVQELKTLYTELNALEGQVSLYS